LPAGTTAQRGLHSSVGHFRYNTSLGEFEGYTSVGWRVLIANATVSSTYVANTRFQSVLANTNSFIKSQLANTNSYIATKLNTTTFNNTLANTNSYIATKYGVANVEAKLVSKTSMAFNMNSTERMRLDSSGTFSVGTTNGLVSELIHARRSSGTISTLYNTGSTGDVLRLYHENTAVTAFSIWGIGAQRGFITSPASSDGLIFGTSSTERMRLDSSGNIGIGTTSPVTTLDVAGTARATQGTPYTTYTANTKTLALTDNGYYTRCSNTTLITITIPNNSTVAFPLGSEMFFFQAGSGNVLFANAAGVTLNSDDGKRRLSYQWRSAVLKKVATNEWDLIGNISL
jgi:hypothetical protein